jgi:hypothetical protein
MPKFAHQGVPATEQDILRFEIVIREPRPAPVIQVQVAPGETHFASQAGFVLHRGPPGEGDPRMLYAPLAGYGVSRTRRCHLGMNRPTSAPRPTPSAALTAAAPM